MIELAPCNNVNDAWSKFKEIFTNILDEIAPIKQIRIKVDLNHG